MPKSVKTALSLICLQLLAPSLWACSVCFGNPESRTTQAAKTGIIFLLAVTVVVLGGIAWTAASWAYRAKKLNARSESPAIDPS